MLRGFARQPQRGFDGLEFKLQHRQQCVRALDGGPRALDIARCKFEVCAHVHDDGVLSARKHRNERAAGGNFLRALHPTRFDPARSEIPKQEFAEDILSHAADERRLGAQTPNRHRLIAALSAGEKF